MRKFGILLIVIFISSPAYANKEKIVEIPIIFSKWGAEVKSSACLRIREKYYETKHSNWKSFKNTALDDPEKSLKETITAMLQKDGSRLKELSHPKFGRDPKKFEKQASAYFEQIGGDFFQISNIKSYLRFDNHMIFFVQIKYGDDKADFADFHFMYDESGSLGFLPYGPYRGGSISSILAVDWFRSDWGPAKNKIATYCDASLLRKITHKVTLEDDILPDSASELLLVGNDLSDEGNINATYSDLLDHIKDMNEALISGRMDEYFNGFTKFDKKRYQEAYLEDKIGEDEARRNRYIEHFMVSEPFYVFNADPIFVVYTRTDPSMIQSLYFVRQGENQFKRYDLSIGSFFDKIFNNKRFIEAAKQEKPFSSWKIIK